MSVYDKYQAVIGLEIHAQMKTESKAFSSDSAEYGGAPNTHVHPISLGHPGTLPKLNKEQIKYAVRMGLACDSKITEVNRFSRKNYFYPDMPKGYQITQFDTPICEGGQIYIKSNGEEKKVALTRIHMEEDSGKSIHDLDPFNSLVDLNRAGVPLIEIVSEPDMRSSDEAYQYLTELRKLVRYLDICDGNMEEGSLRCDANVSVMLKGADQFGQRTEVKNMNSIRNVQTAIEFEIRRQIDIVEAGERVAQETRGFDAVKGTTFTMRSKEDDNDYRFFIEPDLPPLIVNQTYIDSVKADLPALPRALFQKYTQELNLTEYDALNLTDDKGVANYFEELIQHTKNHKLAANWIINAVKGYMNERAVSIYEFPLKPEKIARIIKIVEDGKLSSSAANQNLFPALMNAVDRDPMELAVELNLIQDMSSDDINTFIAEVIARNPDKVAAYKGGNKNLLGMFMGQVMKLSKGKADPKKTNEILRLELEK